MRASSPSLSSRWRRNLLRLTTIVFVVISLGFGYQYGGQALDRRVIHAPGKFVQVDGTSLHLHCTGDGRPVVVLEAGATGFAQTWAWIQADLAPITRVCSYDRAGMGWSEASAVGHDGTAIAHNLRALLQQANESGPYLLIGHSLGGSFAAIFAALYPNDVVALGLVDPTHPDQLDRFPAEARQQQERFSNILQIASNLAHVGIVRATNLLGRLWSGLPEPDYHAARMFSSAPQHLRTSRAEFLRWNATMEAARSIRTLGEIPLVVISSTEGLPEGYTEIFHRMHAELAALSSRGHHVTIEGANHYSLLTNRDHASAMARVLRTLIEDAQNRMAEEKPR
jgi:pimeloyl-ACP methyl ester carboxylesterase